MLEVSFSRLDGGMKIRQERRTGPKEQHWGSQGGSLLNPTRMQLPSIIPAPPVQISFFGIEKLHPFDSCKFKKVDAAAGMLR